jgi:hypothetical protein
MAVVEAFEAQQADALERRRQADADRQARKRDRDKSRDVTLRHSDRSLTGAGDARVEVKTSNLDIEPVEKKDTPRAALEAVLDGQRAAAVLEHRQRLRKPLTAHAAKLLAGKFAACPDPNAAADKMIGNGWQGFEPEWMSKPDARGSPSSKPLSAQEILKARRQVNSDDDRPPNRPVLIASR